MANPDLEIARQLGALTEAVGRSREDRKEQNDRLERVAEGVESIAIRLTALEQSSNSTANMMARVGNENCGMRLDRAEAILFPQGSPALEERIKALEDQVGGWRQWLGSGKSFAVRLILVLVGSSAAWGYISQIFRNLASRL